MNSIDPPELLQRLRAAYEKEKAMREILQQSNVPSTAQPHERLMEAAKFVGRYSNHAICDAFRINRGTFLNHIYRSKGEDNAYARRDTMLRAKILQVFNDHNQIISAAKIAAVMGSSGIPVTDKKVRSLMRDMKLRSIRYNSKTIYDMLYPGYPNHVKRNFTAEKPNQVWASDVTEFKYKRHVYYICVIIDLYSRKAVSHYISMRNSTHLVMMTLRSACKKRNPPADIVFHSDRGTPYTSIAVRKFCAENQMRVSYSGRHNPIDNAVVESFNCNLKTEHLYRNDAHSVKSFIAGIHDYFTYYNTKRPHQTLGYLTPDAFEARYGGSDLKPITAISHQNFDDNAAARFQQAE